MGPCGRQASVLSWQFTWPIQRSLNRYWGRRASTPCARTSPPGKTTGISEDITTGSWHREYHSFVIFFFFVLFVFIKSQEKVKLNVDLTDAADSEWNKVDKIFFNAAAEYSWNPEAAQLNCVHRFNTSIFTLRVPSEGEEWQSVRSLLGKHMLRPKAVEAYDKTLNNVVDDLIAKLRHSRHSQGLITDIASEFYRFGLEGTVSLKYHTSLQGVPEQYHVITLTF